MSADRFGPATGVVGQVPASGQRAVGCAPSGREGLAHGVERNRGGRRLAIMGGNLAQGRDRAGDARGRVWRRLEPARRLGVGAYRSPWAATGRVWSGCGWAPETYCGAYRSPWAVGEPEEVRPAVGSSVRG